MVKLIPIMKVKPVFHFTKKATDILFLPHISSSPGRKIGSWIPDHGTEDKCKNHVHELQKKKKKKWEIMILVFLQVFISAFSINVASSIDLFSKIATGCAIIANCGLSKSSKHVCIAP